VWFSEQTAIIVPKSINRLVFVGNRDASCFLWPKKWICNSCHEEGLRVTNNGFWIGRLDLLVLLLQLHLITITYNSSQSVTAWVSFRFLLYYERLPFHCGGLLNWLLPLTNSLIHKRFTLSLIRLSLILRPAVSRPVCLGIEHPSGAYDQIFITVRQLRICWCEALSLTWGRICCLQLLLVLASAVLFGSESHGTRDHILLSRIRDIPFRRLPRLATNSSGKLLTFYNFGRTEQKSLPPKVPLHVSVVTVL
jgi:hypothetical protein